MNTEQQQSHLTSDCVGDASKTALSGHTDSEAGLYGSPHWSRGGDGVTNFSPHELPLYRRAIAAYGDQSLYIGAPTPNGLTGDFALRQRGRPECSPDLSAFWAVFDELRANSALLAALQEIAREDAGGFYAAIANKALAKAGVTP